MITESRNPRSMHLSELSAEEIVRLMNEEDAAVLSAVRACIPAIAETAELYAKVLSENGRVFYLGAGTSGGIAMLDAAEIPPTFGFPEGRVIALSAEDGIRYLSDDEDNTHKAEEQLSRYHCGADDLVIGIAASGSTPYVAEGLRYARSIGASTAGIVCNRDSVIKTIAGITIEAVCGPEVLTGSTRLKAGTAQKMILNMLSTAAMVRLGKVRSNFMVDVRPMNAKLVKRALSIIREVTGCDEATAEQALRESGNDTRAAVDRILRSGKTF